MKSFVFSVRACSNATGTVEYCFRNLPDELFEKAIYGWYSISLFGKVELDLIMR